MQKNENSNIQELLDTFNKIDNLKQGSIKIQDAVRLLKEILGLDTFNDELLNKVIFNIDRMVSFDEFLALMYEAEVDSGLNKSLVNYRMLDFLKLLDDYRKRCEEASEYIEAEKSYEKIHEIKDKEMKRHRQKLIWEQKSKAQSLSSLQNKKLVEFNTAWDSYMKNYESEALRSIDKLKINQIQDLAIEEERIKNYYSKNIKASKKVIDLRTKEKLLVKQKQYREAERVKSYVTKLEESEKEEKRQEINERIHKRKEIILKQQEVSLMGLLKRLEKERNEQIKKRQIDSEVMLSKLKNIQSDITQKQNTEIKESMSSLRETMCLTESQVTKLRVNRIQSTGGGLINRQFYSNQSSLEKKKTSFKVRDSSFHTEKRNISIYNP